MKVKEFIFLLGVKPRPKTYGFVIEAYYLPGEGRVEVARWLHPGAHHIEPTQAAVDQLRQFLRPGDVAVDIGAHTGDTTIPMALAVGPSGLVLALEPNPYVFPILEQNAALNPGKISVVPLPFAAMRVDGQYEFQYGGPGFCNGGFHEGMSRWLHGSAFKVHVEGKNLLDFIAQRYPDLIPRIRFIKIDTEGFDLAVLETLETLLRSQHPYLQVEMFNLRKSIAGYRLNLYRFLLDHGYELHRIQSGQLWGSLISLDNLMLWNHYDVFCIPTRNKTRD